jgi:hypothetical protein
MSRDEILKYLTILGRELESQGIKGEISIVGGAAIALVHNSRRNTDDIDALYEPKNIIEAVVSKIASDCDLPSDWLNDHFSDFNSTVPPKQHFMSVPGLEIYSVTPSYLLAMKLLAGRDVYDAEDIAILFNKLGLETEEDVYEKVSPYSAELDFSLMSPLIIGNALEYARFLDSEEGRNNAEYDYWNELNKRLLQLRVRKLELEKLRNEEEIILRKLQDELRKLENWPTLKGGRTLPKGLIASLHNRRDELCAKIDGLDRKIKELCDRITARENLLNSEDGKRWQEEKDREHKRLVENIPEKRPAQAPAAPKPPRP